MNQKYSRNEHLKNYKQIQYLFENGIWVNKYPLKFIRCPNLDQTTNFHKFGVSVSKRNYKRAVDRNYIKRLLRECFRLNKDQLYSAFSQPHLFMLLYVGKEIITYKDLEDTYKNLLNKCSFKEQV
ncbi:ribonuclease P protein component [Apibacter muscae]|uniref:ribonuclease P protein component n=1 Tax=Apibacter muscae TaxID=2509004 RepID=UPI0011AD335F|nr:ribonuclease P protein component [Apibacter muscae]TWP24878.1 ribonuclease P protein component [Apibacter muscae]